MKTLIFTAIALCTASALQAEENVHRLEMVVIEAAPEEANPFSSWQPETLGAEIIEIDHSEMATLSLQDLLERQKSLQIRRSGSASSYSTMSLRGASSSQVQVFIDGHPLGDGQGASVDLSTLSLDRFKSIEIYRSHVPARFGSGSMGGAINLISRFEEQMMDQKNGELRLLLGSFGRAGLGLDYRFAAKGIHHQFQFETEKEDGDYDYTDDNLTADITADDVRRTRINNDSESRQLEYQGRVQWKGGSGLNWGLGGFSRDRGLAGPAKFQSPGVRWKEKRGDLKMGYHHSGWGSASARTKLLFNLREAREIYQDPGSNLGLGVQDNLYKSAVRQLDLQHGIANQHSEQQFHLSLRQEEHQTHDRSIQRITPKQKRQQWDLGWEISRHALQDRLKVDLSLASVFWNNQFSSGEENDGSFTPSISARYMLSDVWSIRSGISRGVRHPTMAERFGDRGFSVGNNNLKAEKADHADLALGYELTVENHYQLHGEIAVFRVDREDLIQMVFDSRGIGQAQNLGNGTIDGLEFSINLASDNFWSLGTELTLMDPEVSSPNIAAGATKQIPGIYIISANPWLELKLGAWRCRYDMIIERDKFYDAANFLTSADKTLHQILIQRSFRYVDLSIDLRNLTDERVEDFNNWPAPGRHGSIQLSTRF